MPPSKERRKRSRLNLHWHVSLCKSQQTQPVRSNTQNISSEGFYCLCPEAFLVGEQVECRLSVPPYAFRDHTPPLVLECKARVIRVESDGSNELFGVGFHIESYSVVRSPWL